MNILLFFATLFVYASAYPCKLTSYEIIGNPIKIEFYNYFNNFKGNETIGQNIVATLYFEEYNSITQTVGIDKQVVENDKEQIKETQIKEIYLNSVTEFDYKIGNIYECKEPGHSIFFAGVFLLLFVLVIMPYIQESYIDLTARLNRNAKKANKKEYFN